ncbi:MAG: class I SAM-dependent methyltransferase [Coleofasciculaceae cyanobacterium SM2_3_26]|nr:class I SAM-dependent methyltransferase [Coleofasciculaceae cyanobacterium SM2_3_26]
MDEWLYDLYADLPRQGPGSAEATRRAFQAMQALPTSPRILDIGCGTGKQTLDLATLTDGEVVAVDNYAPFLQRLQERAIAVGVGDRIRCIAADMAALEFPEASFDILWSEGAIYSIGFQRGLEIWQPLLRSAGHIAVTEISWLKPDYPEALQQFWAMEYPAMKSLTENVALVQAAGYRLIEHFMLSEQDWWQDYYAPLETRVAELKKAWEAIAPNKKYSICCR